MVTRFFCLRLYQGRNKDKRVFNLPTIDEVAAFTVVANANEILMKDISGEFMRLHETHISFTPLQHPLLFPYGENGFQDGISYREPVIVIKTRYDLKSALDELNFFNDMFTL